MLKLLLDSREKKLVDDIKERELGKYGTLIDVSVKQLEIADVVIENNEKTLFIERKTVSDMLSSIKDGRYKEQKTRLLASGHDITYIIEGDDILSNLNQRNQDLLSSIYMFSMYRDKIHLVFTKNTNDTATFILTLCAKMIDKPDKFVNGPPDNTPSYVDCIKMKKIKNITPEICYIMQLSQIPTISSTIAKNIQKHYPTMRSLINVLNDTSDKVNLLCEIEKVGKEKAKKILDFLNY
jgi:crossover junction endonuclease MUS81